jgi:superfamily II DNA or RNA helicase
MYQLRDYQQQLVSQVFASWNRGNRKVMLQLPTGAGKTIIVAAIINEFLKEGRRSMIIGHRKELITQAADKIRNITKIEPGIIQSGFEQNFDSYVQVASIQTLIRREDHGKVDLLVFDEAHHTVSNSYKKIFEQYPNALVLGVTATPVRTDGQGFKNIYDDLISGTSVTDLIQKGYLSNFRVFGAVSKIKTQGIKITAGDFNLQELSQAVAEADITGELVPTGKKYAERKKTILFAVDVTHSKQCAKAFSSMGIPAEHIDGKTPAKERDAILERFRNGKTLVLCNCNIVTEGFDVPTIEAIQCVRPTLSFVFYMQMFGRSLRPASGKEYAILIDHTNNWGIHGLPDQPQEWSLEPQSIERNIFTQECPDCGHVFQPLAHEVKEVVGHFLYKNRLLSVHSTICPHCQKKFQFFLGRGQNSKPRQLTLDLREEYGQIVEVARRGIVENQPIHKLFKTSTKNVEQIRSKYGGLVSLNSINLTNVLGITAKVYVYGTRLETYHSEKTGLIQDCYQGTAVLEIKAEEQIYKLALAEITPKKILANQKILILLALLDIDMTKSKEILKRVGQKFCFQIKLADEQKKAALREAERHQRIETQKRLMEALKASKKEKERRERKKRGDNRNTGKPEILYIHPKDKDLKKICFPMKLADEKKRPDLADLKEARRQKVEERRQMQKRKEKIRKASQRQNTGKSEIFYT